MVQLLSTGFSEQVYTPSLSATAATSTPEPAHHHQGANPDATPTLEDDDDDDDSAAGSPAPLPQTKSPQAITCHSPPSPPLPDGDTAVWEPLAERMRPRTVDEVVGQDHILGPGSVLRAALARGLLPSLILWGPPGTGKTSIARAIAAHSSSSYRFVSLCAVTASVGDVRDAVEEARGYLEGPPGYTLEPAPEPTRTVLFMDEVHRFSRAQQDVFLDAVEDGSIVLVGATTENPSFHLTPPLLSRCRVLTLRPLEPSHVAALLRRSVEDPARGVAAGIGPSGGTQKERPFVLDEDAVEFLSLHCDGDARVALNALEVAATLAFERVSTSSGAGDEEVAITLGDVRASMQSKHLAYDRAGDGHYNAISALHKSMRGGDADAAIYWLARMLEGGEQPLYIARRLVRFASEDVGLGDPSALVHAVACYQACHLVGLPGCGVNLAQCVSYLALAPKSVAVYRAMEAAKRLVRESGGVENAPTWPMEEESGYENGYPDSSSQTYLPSSLLGHKLLDWPTSAQQEE